ncbi:hypothetical protein [Aeromonas salmonicida]|uniref:hypothetical protein n=1 Tax=Aeromonas salmonicida TaxID=645 RepID=UPI00232B82A9|nr:hypothetical protein [Aeromonas salmonicida]WCH26547.1 hypothetical protein ONZ66_18575 [Aeromonas salmonicida]
MNIMISYHRLVRTFPSTPELSGEIDVLKKHIDQMMGPDYPVSEEKYRAALDAANQFGRNVTSYIKHHD